MEFKNIVGENMVYIGRCSDMIDIEFGETISTEFMGCKRELPQYYLHIQCPFRIEKNKQILIGSRDVYFTENGIDEMDWAIYGNNNYDKIVTNIIMPLLPIKVIDIVISDSGDILISLQNNIKIRVFINAGGNIDTEFWRLVDCKKYISFVCEGKGITKNIY